MSTRSHGSYTHHNCTPLSLQTCSTDQKVRACCCTNVQASVPNTTPPYPMRRHTFFHIIPRICFYFAVVSRRLYDIIPISDSASERIGTSGVVVQKGATPAVRFAGEAVARQENFIVPKCTQVLLIIAHISGLAICFDVSSPQRSPYNKFSF